MAAVVDWCRTHRCLGFPPAPASRYLDAASWTCAFAHDIPTVRAPIARLLHFTNGKIEKRKNCAMSALPLKADIAERDRHVR